MSIKCKQKKWKCNDRVIEEYREARVTKDRLNVVIRCRRRKYTKISEL